MAGETMSRDVPMDNPKKQKGESFENASNAPNNPSNGWQGAKDNRPGNDWKGSFNVTDDYCDGDNTE